MAKKIMVVDDDPGLLKLVDQVLTQKGYAVLKASNGQEALKLMFTEKPDLVLLDVVMPGMDGIELLKRAKVISPGVEVIIITAYGSIPTAITAMREGAYDYIEKPFCPEKAELLIERVAQYKGLVEENISLHQKLEERYRFENIIGRSLAMTEVYEVIKKVASSEANILILDAPGHECLCYHFGVNLVQTVIKNGRVVVEGGQLLG